MISAHAAEVNEAVERAHRDGILSAASLMVAGTAAARCGRARAKAMPKLRVGLHLVLVEGKPVLPAAAVPDLVDSSGYFRTDMARAGAAMFFLPKVRRAIGGGDCRPVRGLCRHRPGAGSRQCPQAFSSSSHHRRADDRDGGAVWCEGRAGAAGAAGGAGRIEPSQGVRPWSP